MTLDDYRPNPLALIGAGIVNEIVGGLLVAIGLAGDGGAVITTIGVVLAFIGGVAVLAGLVFAVLWLAVPERRQQRTVHPSAV